MRGSRSQASRPSCSCGTHAVVSGGQVKAANGMSSKPTTDSSPGTSVPELVQRPEQTEGDHVVEGDHRRHARVQHLPGGGVPVGEHRATGDLDHLHVGGSVQRLLPGRVGPAGRRALQVGDPAMSETGEVAHQIPDPGRPVDVELRHVHAPRICG